LSRLVGADPDSRIQFSEEFEGSGAAFFRVCAEHSLEGIVSKHALAPYRSGRSKTWLKSKCFTETNFLVIGTDWDRKTGAIRALLAHTESGGLVYAGAAFIALSGDERSAFFDQMGRLKTSWAAFKSSRLTDVNWCQPALAVRVKHLVGSKMLRHATVRGFAQP
jgi:bifunctional non-homologous end joining protein LigD